MPIEIAYDHAPNNSGESFKRYVEHKVPTGGFLRALLENDLREAFGRADYINVGLIQAYVSWMYNNLPSACWGSKENVAAWLGGKL